MCVMCLKYTMGLVIIPKPKFSSLEGINSRRPRFDLLLFRRFYSICRRSDCCRFYRDQLLFIYMTTVVDVSMAINRTLGFCARFEGFTPIQICWAELRCKSVRERNVSRYEQFELSPEMIEQELQAVDCKQ